MESFCVIIILLIVVSMSQYNCEQICLQLPNDIKVQRAHSGITTGAEYTVTATVNTATERSLSDLWYK